MGRVGVRELGRSLGVGLCCAWVAAAGLAAEPAPAARLASAGDTLIYAQLNHPGELLARGGPEGLPGLLKSVPGLARSLDEPQTREAYAALAYLATTLETTPRQLVEDVAGKRLSLAIEGENRALLVIEPEDPAQLVRVHEELLELARADARDKGADDPVKQGEYRGVTGYSLDNKVAHAIIDGKLFITSGPDMMKAVIDRVLEPDQFADPLCEDAFWKSRSEEASSSTIWVLGWLDRLRQASPSQFTMKEPDAGAVFLFGPWLDQLAQADWAMARLTWDDAQLSLDIDLPAGDVAERFKGYRPADGQGAPAPLTIDGSVANLSLYRDFAAIWESRGSIFPPEAQKGIAELDSFAGQFFGGRDFGTGVLGALGTHWQLVVTRQDAADLDRVPDTILPAAAIVMGVDPEDPEFALRLKTAFQSLVGLTNLDAAQKKNPTLLLETEQFQGITISYARYLPPQRDVSDEPVPQRFNYSPAIAQVGDQFFLSSSLPLARDLVEALQKNEGKPAEVLDSTLQIVASGEALGTLIDQNREALIADRMLKEGQDRDRASQDIELLESLVRYLGQGRLQVVEEQERLHGSLRFDLQTR